MAMFSTMLLFVSFVAMSMVMVVLFEFLPLSMMFMSTLVSFRIFSTFSTAPMSLATVDSV
jgi:hypothetical protein